LRTKVIAAAQELGLELEVRTLMTPTRTVPEAAEAVGCEPARIAKSVVFVCDGDPIVCVASGAHRIDVERLYEVFDCAEIHQASPDEVRAATGFPVGGVPPVGHGLPVVFDASLLECPTVWAAGGDGNTLFEVDPRELVERLGAQVAAVGATT
jgi:prolyl-tRNA editing enzyme YbaK/EbsC (Cys-tRNA(Pro) deacylase)